MYCANCAFYSHPANSGDIHCSVNPGWSHLKPGCPHWEEIKLSPEDEAKLAAELGLSVEVLRSAPPMPSVVVDLSEDTF